MTYEQINKVRQDLTARAHEINAQGCPPGRLLDELHNDWAFWEKQPAMTQFEKYGICRQVVEGCSTPALVQ